MFICTDFVYKSTTWTMGKPAVVILSISEIYAETS